MLAYKAMFKYCDDGVHAEVLDFPGAISCGDTLDEARTNLAGALVDMAEAHMQAGEALPTPNPNATDADSDIEEPIHLLLTATSDVKIIPAQTTP